MAFTYRSRKGWYKIKNPQKFIRPIDETMKSTLVKDDSIFINYKSSLERRAFAYADINPKVKYFSIEPFPITYIKPTDDKAHRYYIDMFIEFIDGSKFLVEIKSHQETVKPQKPKKITEKSLITYKRQIQTYLINQSKWKSAMEFAKSKNFKFIILTENELRKVSVKK